MSGRAPGRGRTRGSWTGVAFMVEALLLLVFLVGSLAVFTQLFAGAVQRGEESRRMTAAVAAACDAAERFSAAPSSVEAESEVGDLRVVCDVADDRRAGGTFHDATISVYAADGRSDEPLYTIRTGCYESRGA